MTNELVVEEFEHAGLTVKIVADEHIEPGFYDPREHDNLGRMFVSYRDYELGDEQLPDAGFEEIECPTCEGEGEVEQRAEFADGQTVDDHPLTCERCVGTGMVEPTVQEWLSERDAIGGLPLFVYEHSGITIRAGSWITAETISREDTISVGRFIGDDAGWDTSFVGFIIVTTERVREMCGTDRYKPDDFAGTHEEWLAEQLRTEVAEYAKYLEGDAGGFVIEDEDGEHLESCWGFLGLADEHVRDEAKAAAEHARNAIERENSEREFWAARDVTTT